MDGVRNPTEPSFSCLRFIAFAFLSLFDYCVEMHLCRSCMGTKARLFPAPLSLYFSFFLMSTHLLINSYPVTCFTKYALVQGVEGPFDKPFDTANSLDGDRGMATPEGPAQVEDDSSSHVTTTSVPENPDEVSLHLLVCHVIIVVDTGPV